MQVSHVPSRAFCVFILVHQTAAETRIPRVTHLPLRLNIVISELLTEGDGRWDVFAEKLALVKVDSTAEVASDDHRSPYLREVLRGLPQYLC